jgi:hypothetical protein
VLALLAGHLALSVWPGLTLIRNDFPSYYLTARAAAEGRSVAGAYDRAFWVGESARAGLPTVGTFVPHPPANALLLLPVARLPPAPAKAIASGLLALLLAASCLLLPRVSPEAGPWLCALALLTQTASIRNALLYGQPYPLLLLLLVGSLLALLRGRPLAAGLLLAPVVALKLYALPFVLFLLVTRRWRAAAGVVAGVAAVTIVSLAVLGPEIHRVYATQVLGESLDGRVLDPYSTVWGSPASVARRLFQLEPELNPHPVADAPVLARALARGAGALIGLFAVACAIGHDRAGRLRLAWATLAVGSLAASPLPSSYHMVLLAMPAAILVAESSRAWERAGALALAALAGSPLVHYAAPLAQGWGNLLAPLRLFALLALLAMCVRTLRLRTPVALALAGGALAATTALAVRPEDAGWRRVPEAHGLIVAEPASCPDGLAWLVVQDGRYRYRRGDGERVDAPPCVPSALSPDGAWLAYSRFTDGSWDVWARHQRTGEIRRVTRDPANEREPAWLPGGDAIVFASDRRRGLGATTLFVVRF